VYRSPNAIGLFGLPILPSAAGLVLNPCVAFLIMSHGRGRVDTFGPRSDYNQRPVGWRRAAFATAKANAEKNLQNARALFESHLQSVFTQRGEGWVERPLAELCDIKHGFAFKSEFFTPEGDYVLLTPGNFYESGGYRDRGEKQKYYTGEIPPDFVLSEGDLLVAITEQAAGLLGRAGSYRTSLMTDETPKSEIVLYESEDGRTRIKCRFENETIWLTQIQIAKLFQTSVPNVNQHLKTIYDEGELMEAATIKSYLIVRTEGNREVSREVLHYNLSLILAVGYRVRSARGTQFRQWATARLSEYLVKGFTMDDERLKNPPGPGIPDYFDDLLERIRDIRASERRMYLRVKEIFALASDYSTTESQAQLFFKTIQNKLHFAATGKTAPQLITERADSTQPNMGLTSWKAGTVRKADVTVAKNYLNENEIDELNRTVVMFLDYAEDQAKRRKQVWFFSQFSG